MPLSVLPGSLSISGSVGSVYASTGFRWDYAINSLPFLSGANRQYPIVRETAQVRKQQWDTSGEPGENSLEGWWLRSQSSFHGGAGLTFLDVDEQNTATNFTRYHSSVNVDVWTEGKVTLLPAVNANTTMSGVVDGTEVTYGDGTAGAVLVTASTVWSTDSGGGGSGTVTTATVGTNYAVTTNGSHVFLATSSGLYSAAVPSISVNIGTPAKQYTYTATNGTLAFVKSRIMLGLDNSIYEIPPYPATPPAALPTAKYTHPDPNWRWTYFTEMNNAIYAVGNNGVRGAIVKFVLGNTTGSIPTLTGAAAALQLPAGEVPYSAQGYMGSYMGIGTNKGVRIATGDTNGDLTYGPLLFSSTGPVRSWTARDRFLYCGVPAGVDGASGIYRIDLSTQVGELRFAYATDVNKPGDTGVVEVVCHFGSSSAYMFCTPTATYWTHLTQLATSGYLRTPRVRYGTLEPKHFKLYRLRGPALSGTISVQTLDSYDAVGSSYTYGTGDTPNQDTAITPATPQDFMSLKITLNRSATDATLGAEMWGYQFKGLPASTRNRMIQLPLLCYDFERDRLGNRRGGVGTASDRLFALETAERDGTPVQLQDYTTGELVNCVIDQVRFIQDEPPSGAAGFGGLIILTLRTL